MRRPAGRGTWRRGEPAGPHRPRSRRLLCQCRSSASRCLGWSVSEDILDLHPASGSRCPVGPHATFPVTAGGLLDTIPGPSAVFAGRRRLLSHLQGRASRQGHRGGRAGRSPALGLGSGLAGGGRGPNRCGFLRRPLSGSGGCLRRACRSLAHSPWRCGRSRAAAGSRLSCRGRVPEQRDLAAGQHHRCLAGG
jgi:hypothetical protein